MYPPVFPTVNTPAVQALLKTGNGPLRVFPFGQAPQQPERPYVVWQTRGGVPENYLNQVPDIDSLSVQLDVYASEQQGSAFALQCARALRDAIEPHAHVRAWIGDSQDPITKNWRFTFITDWWVSR